VFHSHVVSEAIPGSRDIQEANTSHLQLVYDVCGCTRRFCKSRNYRGREEREEEKKEEHRESFIFAGEDREKEKKHEK